MLSEEQVKIFCSDETGFKKTENNHVEGSNSNWRLLTNQERFQHALSKSIYTDIDFEVGPDSTRFSAHKLILSLSSPVFAAMFHGELAETAGKVVIPDIMPGGFEVLLQFMYTDQANFENLTQAFQTWIAADKYCVPTLKMYCNAFFESCPLDCATVWDVLDNAYHLDMHHFKKRCLDFVSRETYMTLTSGSFLEVTSKTLEEVISMDALNVSELVLLYSVVEWGRKKLQTTQGTTLREVLDPLLRHIRFATLRPDEFCNFIEFAKDLFDDSEALCILKHLTDPTKFSAPSWCTEKAWERATRKIAEVDRPVSSRKRKNRWT